MDNLSIIGETFLVNYGNNQNKRNLFSLMDERTRITQENNLQNSFHCAFIWLFVLMPVMRHQYGKTGNHLHRDTARIKKTLFRS